MKGVRTASTAFQRARTAPLGPVCQTSTAFPQWEIRRLGSLCTKPQRCSAPLARKGACRLVAPGHLTCQRRNSSDDASRSDGGLGHTALHQLHVESGGKMVPFGGYSMPVQYSDLSVGESHRWTREKASLFDVGHMYVHSPIAF